MNIEDLSLEDLQALLNKKLEQKKEQESVELQKAEKVLRTAEQEYKEAKWRLQEARETVQALRKSIGLKAQPASKVYRTRQQLNATALKLVKEDPILLANGRVNARATAKRHSGNYDGPLEGAIRRQAKELGL